MEDADEQSEPAICQSRRLIEGLAHERLWTHHCYVRSSPLEGGWPWE